MVFSGAGSAAISITKLLLEAGFKDITLCDKFGALYEGNPDMNWAQQEIAKRTNLEKRKGTLADMLVGADVFIGVSAPNLVTTEMVKTMNKDAIVFACANPTPEIFPEDAKAGGARWSPPAAATIPTRSTTSWLSRAFSAVLWTCGPAISTRR